MVTEVANGRLAMVTIMGMMLQNGVTGMWVPGASLDNKFGVQAPVGFFDPVGSIKGRQCDQIRAAPG